MKISNISEAKIENIPIINANSIILIFIVLMHDHFELIQSNLIKFSKLALYYFGVISIIIVTAYLFMTLFIRALDIQAEEQTMIVEQHQQYLEIKLSHDAP